MNFKILVDVRFGKSDMARNPEIKNISARDRYVLRTLLSDEDTFAEPQLNKLGWSVGKMDDKSIFDEDAARLASAIQLMGYQDFCVTSTAEILHSSEWLAYVFAATAQGIEQFQHPAWLDLTINDCLIFNVPIHFAVLRTGGVEYTLYTGPEVFVSTALGSSSSMRKI